MSAPFRIDGWLAEPDLNTFTRDGRTVRVEPKIMELCVRLAQTPGAVVSKAELLESVWPDTAVGEDALTRAVSELRRALGDDAQKPRVVQTIPKRGYRLVASVDRPLVAAIGPQPGRRASALPWLLAASLTGILLLSAWWPGAWRGVDATPGAPPVEVLVAGFEDRPGNARVNEILRAAIESGLQREGVAAVVSRQRVAEIRARMRQDEGVRDLDGAVAVARRDRGIRAIVMARLEETPGESLVALQAISASGDRVLGSRIARAADAGTLAMALEREAASLRAVLLSLPPRAGASPPAVTTASFAALQSFARGVEIAESSLAVHGGSWPKAVELFRQATELDPEFAIAHAWLGLALKYAMETELSAHGQTAASATRLHEHARTALALAGSAATDDERFFVEGVAHALLDARPQAIAALSALAWRDGGFMDLPVRLLLAFLYGAEGRPEEAEEQVLRLAELKPDDFDANAMAGHVLIARGEPAGGAAAPFLERARRHASPEVVNRENSCWLAAWLEHLPVYERWSASRMAAALEAQGQIARTLPDLPGELKDAMATTAGYMWLTLGRVADARAAFGVVAHVGQREMNFARMADLLDDRDAAADHLSRIPWAFSPIPFARAGELTRARAILRQPMVNGPRLAEEAIVAGEEALAAGRPAEAVRHLQRAVELLRRRPHVGFYDASLSLARAWQQAGDSGQALRVLEEAARTRPTFATTGLAGAWWIKAQVRLVELYREADRLQEASALEGQVRAWLGQADSDHPFLKALNAS